MFRSSFKVKCPESGTKTHVQYVTVARFLYVGTGTNCSVFITLLEVGLAIAAVQNSNNPLMSINLNALTCWKYTLYQIQPYPIVLKNTEN